MIEKPTYAELERKIREFEKIQAECIETENALRESEERFRRIYENMAVGVAWISMNYRIEGANEAYCRMLGYSETELMGKHLRDITHPDSVEDNLIKQSELATGEIDHYRIENAFYSQERVRCQRYS
jgi:PAS domain S-box-containing protein